MSEYPYTEILENIPHDYGCQRVVLQTDARIETSPCTCSRAKTVAYVIDIYTESTRLKAALACIAMQDENSSQDGFYSIRYARQALE